MFKKLFFTALLFISTAFFSSGQIYAQEEEGKIIVISEKVGEVIDSEENKKYNLFPAIKGFQSGVFLRLSDGSYVFKVTNIDETTGEEKVKRIPITESIIKIYGSSIDQFKEIQLESKEKKKEKKVEKPPLNAGRIVGELFAGGVGGVVIGYALLPKSGEGEYRFLQASLYCTLSNVIIVYIVGNIGDKTGSFVATLFLGAIGGILGGGIGGDTYHSDLDFEGSFYGSMIGAPIGATLGFNLTRRYDKPKSETAFINFRNGRTSFAVPNIYFRPNPLDKGDLIQTINLVKVRF